ncbi:hypothetical protein FF1_029986 [Malus domestica]
MGVVADRWKRLRLCHGENSEVGEFFLFFLSFNCASIWNQMLSIYFSLKPYLYISHSRFVDLFILEAKK